LRKDSLVIPISVFIADIAILLDIPIFTEIIVFLFLSFIPGIALLRLFELKKISFLDTIIFSVGLSIFFVMFVSLLVNELYLFLGLSHPLSMLPLTVALSVFTLALFLIGYRRDVLEIFEFKTSFEGKLKDVLPLSIILFLIPLFSVLGALFHTTSLILLSDAIIATLFVVTIISRRLIPRTLFPLMIFSISIALVCQVLLASKYVVGVDSNIEYYVFSLTKINGQWGFTDVIGYLQTFTFNSMLSITLLPTVYAVLMQAQGDIVFKILYAFIFLFVPLTIYRISEIQFGKMIGLFSAFFFVFTNVAFYGEPLGLNREIVGLLFFALSVFLLISNFIPVTKRRWLLIIFGASLAVSHYALAYVYLLILATVFIVPKVKPRFDEIAHTALDGATILLVFAITILWFSIGPSSPLVTLSNSFKATFVEFTEGLRATGVTANTLYAFPSVFTVASWINLLFSGIANLFLIVGILAILMKLKGKGIIGSYKVIMILAAIILLVALIIPQFAGEFNFSRFYGVSMLFLSPCFVFGGQTLLETIGKAWNKVKPSLKNQILSKNNKIDTVFLLIAIILSAYFLSQVGFVNYVTNGAVHTYGTDFVKMETSNDITAKLVFYGWFNQEPDVLSASWLLRYRAENAEVFADYLYGSHALVSYGLIPIGTTLDITNTTNPSQGSYLFLGSLNVVYGVMYRSNGLELVNTSKVSPLLDNNSLVYSNGKSEIFFVVTAN
jgi:uncharacterized membrane protein